MTARAKEKEEEEKENDDDSFQSSKNVTAAATIQFHPHEKKEKEEKQALVFTPFHFSRHFYSFQLFFQVLISGWASCSLFLFFPSLISG